MLLPRSVRLSFQTPWQILPWIHYRIFSIFPATDWPGRQVTCWPGRWVTVSGTDHRLRDNRHLRRGCAWYRAKIKTCVDIFSLFDADLTGQCHSQFKIETCVAFFKPFVSFKGSMGFPNPVSKQAKWHSSYQSDLLFSILHENTNS